MLILQLHPDELCDGRVRNKAKAPSLDVRIQLVKGGMDAVGPEQSQHVLGMKSAPPVSHWRPVEASGAPSWAISLSVDRHNGIQVWAGGRPRTWRPELLQEPE